MLSIEIFRSQRVWHPFWIEARAFVANDERNTGVCIALAANVNFLFRIFAIAVQDGVRQSLPKRQLDREFRARVTVNFANLEHQLIDEGRDRVDFTLHRKLQLQFGPPRIESCAASY